MTNPFNWAYLTQVPKNMAAYGPFGIAFLAVCVLGLVASIVLSRWLTRRCRPHALPPRLTDRPFQTAARLSGVGPLPLPP